MHVTDILAQYLCNSFIHASLSLKLFRLTTPIRTHYPTMAGIQTIWGPKSRCRPEGGFTSLSPFQHSDEDVAITYGQFCFNLTCLTLRLYLLFFPLWESRWFLPHSQIQLPVRDFTLIVPCSSMQSSSITISSHYPFHPAVHTSQYSYQPTATVCTCILLLSSSIFYSSPIVYFPFLYHLHRPIWFHASSHILSWSTPLPQHLFIYVRYWAFYFTCIIFFTFCFPHYNVNRSPVVSYNHLPLQTEELHRPT